MYGLPQMVSVERFTNLPIVKSSLNTATNVYFKVKKSNRLIEWSLSTAEGTVIIAINLSKPTILLLDGPIHLVDEILCKSLDMVEEAVPIIKSEPEKIMIATKELVSSVMEPVLKRADSVKEISIQSAITYSSIAAESLDNALTVADGYVNKYLPELPSDSTTSIQPSVVIPASPEPQNPTERTIRHVNKFSRTLKRRLTQRTLYEARELRKQGVNVINILIQLTDLLARDPKGFSQKIKEVWGYLSQDEPENQAPPQNLEQLLVMVTREGARRFVHFTNYVVNTSLKVPQYAQDYISYALHEFKEYYLQVAQVNKNGVQFLVSKINEIFDKFFSLLKVTVSPPPERLSIIPLSNKNSIKKKEIQDTPNSEESVKNSQKDGQTEDINEENLTFQNGDAFGSD